MRTSLVSLLVLMPLALGCPKRVPLGLPGEIPDARTLLEQSSAAEARVSSVRGEARLHVDSPDAKGGVTLFVAAARPVRVHLQSLDFFGRPQAILVSDGERFGLYQAQEGRYYRGPPSARNISRFLPVVLPPGELVALLLGQAPRIPFEQAAVEADRATNAWLVTLTRGTVSQRLWIHPRHHRILRSEIRGEDAYDLAFEDFQETGTLAFPRRIILSVPAARTRLELRYTDVTLNEAPDPDLFVPESPEGIPVLEVDEGGQPRSVVPTTFLRSGRMG